MRILVVGAGVLGSLYAARLHDAGHDVTILARGERLAWIREHGIVVLDEANGLTSTSLVPAVDAPGGLDSADIALVFVRREQRLDAARLMADTPVQTVLFMGNDATAGEQLSEVLGARLVLGFPSAGGTLVDGLLHARVARASSPTVIGEPDGAISERVRELAVVFQSAGFPSAVTRHVGPWLRTHASVVVPVAAALYGADGDVRRLAATPDLLLLAIRAVRESLEVLRRLDIPVTPPAYRRIVALPEGLLSTILARGLATDVAELMLAGHALHARAEMAALDADLAALAGRAGLATPNLDRLRTWLDPAMAPMETGSRTLVVRHPLRSAAVTGAGTAAGLGVALLVVRRVRPDLVATLSAAAVARRLPAVPPPSMRLPTFEAPVVRRPEIGRIAVPGWSALWPSESRLPDLPSAAALRLPGLVRRAASASERRPIAATRASADGFAAGVPIARWAPAAASALGRARFSRARLASVGPTLDRDIARSVRIAGLALLAPLVLAIAGAILLPSGGARTMVARLRGRAPTPTG